MRGLVTFFLYINIMAIGVNVVSFLNTGHFIDLAVGSVNLLAAIMCYESRKAYDLQSKV